MRQQSRQKIRRPFKLTHVCLILLAAVSLGACASTKLPASVVGVCSIIPKAEYEVLGQTAYDQDYVDASVIAGATCGHEPPKPRPAEWDKKPTKPPVTAKPTAKRKPGFVARVKAKLTHRTIDEPSAPIVVPASLPQVGQPLPVPEPVVEPVPAQPKPRSPVERLLDPDGRRS